MSAYKQYILRFTGYFIILLGVLSTGLALTIFFIGIYSSGKLESLKTQVVEVTPELFEYRSTILYDYSYEENTVITSESNYSNKPIYSDEILAGYANKYAVSTYHPKTWNNPRWSSVSKKSIDITSIPSFIPLTSRTESDMLPLHIPELNMLPIAMKIPTIGVNSPVANLAVINDKGVDKYETPKNLVGRISLSDSDSGSWYFGHLESPLKNEGNVFHNLPLIAEYINDGDPIFIHLIHDNTELIYQAVQSTVLHESQLKLFDPGIDNIILITCANRPYYDQRQIVTAKLIGQIQH
jgi:sortase (surface protein transpeptidase)